jgi:superfamily II RNA helicase
MAGRAGRRGIDPKGVVIYCPLRKPEFEDTFQAMATGRKSAFSSRMDFGFAFIFKALHSQSYHWTTIVQESFWFVELMTHKDAIARELLKTKEIVASLELSLGPYCADLAERHKIDVNDELMPAKDRQKKLGAWDNAHMGKIWQTRYTDWKHLQVQRDRLISLQDEHAATGDMELFMRGYATYLEMTGFLKELPETCYELSHAHLTLKGQLATECNETNCILAPELFLWLTTTDEGRAALPEDPCDLVALLTLFMTQVSVGTRRDDDDAALAASSSAGRILRPAGAIVDFVVAKRQELRALSDDMTLGLPESTWALTLDKENCVLYSMVWDWMSGRPISDIVGSYDIDEGSLIRTMLKMGNVVEGVGLRVYADVFQFELSFLFPHGNQLTVLRRVAQPRDSLWPSQHAAILAAC